MATVIDSLVVSLGLDASGFNAGQRAMVQNLRAVEGEATRTAKSMQASGQQAAEFFSSIKTQALSLLGIFLGGQGIESFVRNTARSMATLGQQAVAIGESAADVNAFSQAIARMNGNAEAAIGTLQNLANAKQQWLTRGNNPEFVAFLSYIGANPNMTPLQIVSKFADFTQANQGTPQGVQNIRQYGAGIGLDPQTINSIIQMVRTSSLSAELSRSRELFPLAPDMIKNMTDLQTSLKSLEQAVDGLASAFLNKVAPGLIRALNDITETIIHPPKQPTAEERARELVSPGSGLGRVPEVPGVRDWMRRHLPTWLGGDPAPSSGLPGPRANPNDPRGIRNNNPLNLEYRPGQGASGSDGRFGVYPTMEGGVAAAANQLKIYRDRYGLNTIGGIIGRWAPQGENNTGAYAMSVSRSMGMNPNDQLDLNDPSVMSRLIGAMAEVENGRAVDAGAINRGVRGLPAQTSYDGVLDKAREARAAVLRAQGINPGGDYKTLSRDQLDLPPGAIPPSSIRGGPRAVLPGPRISNDNSTAVQIDNLSVHTQATDAKGISAQIQRSLSEEISAQSNRGLR